MNSCDSLALDTLGCALVLLLLFFPPGISVPNPFVQMLYTIGYIPANPVLVSQPKFPSTSRFSNFALEVPMCAISSHLLVWKRIANGVGVNPSFLTSHMISCLSYMSWGAWVTLVTKAHPHSGLPPTRCGATLLLPSVAPALTVNTITGIINN